MASTEEVDEVGEARDSDQCVPSAAPAYPTCVMPSGFNFYLTRYYSHYLVPNAKGFAGNHLRILQHSNHLIVLCVDPTHAALSERHTITRVHHDVRRGGKLRDRLDAPTKLVGKRKRNAMYCQEETVLAIIETADGTEFRIPATINGIVLEINPNISRDPTLIKRCPVSEGFVAVINPRSGTKFDGYTLISTMTHAYDGEDAQERGPNEPSET